MTDSPARFTIVFEGGIRKLDFNPNKTETIYGRQVASPIGDALESLDARDAEVEGWKRVAVMAALALETIRMSGAHERFVGDLRQAVDDAVVAIRRAIAGDGFPDVKDVGQ